MSTDTIQDTRVTISNLTDEQVISVAKSLGWKDAPADKLRGTLNLNAKTAKVQAAVQAEIEWKELSEAINQEVAEAEAAKRFSEENPELEYIEDEEILEQEEKEAGKSFGMNEEAAAKYIEEEFGLTPRMAKRAIMRGINRDEYHGKGYVVKVVDTSEDSFDISVFAA